MLHFTPRAQWADAERHGEYQPAGMAEEGFVHLSFGYQLARVATQLARGADDLILLVVDPAGLESDLRVEEGFPHLYRPVPVGSVRLVVDLPPQDDGGFQVPEPARLAELAITAQPSAPAALDRVRSVMEGFMAPWWLAGGWAADAAAPAPSRPHLDLDVAVLRRDMAALGEHLASWDLRIPHDGQLVDWASRDFPADEHQVWARPHDGFHPSRWQDFAADPGFVEFLVEDLAEDANWVFRRGPSVQAPLERLGQPGGFLSAEVALLYKAKGAESDDANLSAKAQGDFDLALGYLDQDQRSWLREAVRSVTPNHLWVTQLAE